MQSLGTLHNNPGVLLYVVNRVQVLSVPAALNGGVLPTLAQVAALVACKVATC